MTQVECPRRRRWCVTLSRFRHAWRDAFLQRHKQKSAMIPFRGKQGCNYWNSLLHSHALRLNSSQNVDLPQLLKNLDPCRLKTVITGEELNVHAAGTAHSDALNSTLKNKSQTKRMSACLLCHLRAGSISPSLILQICFWSNSLFHVVEITPSILSSWPSSAL